MQPQKGDIVAYHAFAGDIWKAVVLGIVDEGHLTFVDLEVIVRGEERMTLRAVRWCDGPAPCAGPARRSDGNGDLR